MRTRAAQLAVPILGLAALACGHKEPPLPPPLMHPAPTYDLQVQQRGGELILKFTYPQTTVSGLPLAALEKVEFWELVKPTAPSTLDVEEAAGDEPVGKADEAAGDESEPEGEESGEPEMEPDDEAEPDEETAEELAEEPQEEVVPLGATPEVPLPPPLTKEQIAAVELLEFEATAQLRLVLESEELTAATVGDKIVLRLPLPEIEDGEEAEAETETDTETEAETEAEAEAEAAEKAYSFSIKTFTDPRRASAWSNIATLVRRQAPASPDRFAVEADAGGVRITWFNQRAEDRKKAIAEATAAGLPPPAPDPIPTTVPGEEDATEIKSYRIYRRDAQARVYPPYIGQVLRDSDEYLDRTAQYGSRYIYSLAAVGLYTPLVESELAGEIEIDYQDRFAPPAPANPIALAEAGRVRVLWDASPAPDLKGYLVFRRVRGEPDFVQLSAKTIVDLEYNDRDVAGGTAYEYRIVAVDRVGNEGEPSATVGARTP